MCIKCDQPSITSDDYCENHTYYSHDEKHIIKHVQNYQNKVIETKADHEIKRSVICINLFNYLKYQIDFVKKHDQFYKAIKDRCIFIKKDLENADHPIKKQLYNIINEFEELL